MAASADDRFYGVSNRFDIRRFHVFEGEKPPSVESATLAVRNHVGNCNHIGSVI
jgi:hypothetical protein